MLTDYMTSNNFLFTFILIYDYWWTVKEGIPSVYLCFSHKDTPNQKFSEHKRSLFAKEKEEKNSQNFRTSCKEKLGRQAQKNYLRSQLFFHLTVNHLHLSNTVQTLTVLEIFYYPATSSLHYQSSNHTTERKSQNQLIVCPSHMSLNQYLHFYFFLLLIIKFDRLTYLVDILSVYKLKNTSLEKGTYWFRFLCCEMILKMNLISSL